MNNQSTASIPLSIPTGAEVTRLPTDFESLRSAIRHHLPQDHRVLDQFLIPFTRNWQRQCTASPPPFSRLTVQGVPMELAYVWPANSFRFTVDCDARADAADRLIATRNYFGKSNYPRQQEMLVQLLSWQREQNIRYGAWLGGRCNHDQMRYKLYLELAANAPWRPWEEHQLGRKMYMPAESCLSMAGFDTLSGATEFYYRMNRISVPSLRPIQLSYGLPDRTEEILDLLQSFCQRHYRFEIPSLNLGYSISFDHTMKAGSFTLYAMANSLLGKDTDIRASLIRLGKDRKWDTGLYEDTSGHVLIRELKSNHTWHGLLGIVAVPGQPLQLTLGWTPFLRQYK